MTPDEHYREAERLLRDAKASQPSYDKDRKLREAQVHATLATAPWSVSAVAPTPTNRASVLPRPSR